MATLYTSAKAPKEPGNVSMKRVLMVVGACLGIGYLVLNTANHLMGRALLVALGDVESTYRSALVSWNGDITARDLVVYLYEDDPDTPGDVRFEHVRLETPGLHWVLWQTATGFKFGRFDRRKRGKTPHLDALRLTFTGIESDQGDDPTLGYLGPAGAISASPFEAEGCSEDGFWLRDEIAEMGLSPGTPTLSMEMRIEGGRLLQTHVLSTEGVGEVRFQREESLPSGHHNALLLDFVEGQILSDRLSFRDAGFVAARNAFCAREAGIAESEFVERHLASVERLLAVLGLGIDAQSRARYRRFASEGGVLELAANYGAPVSTLYDDPFERTQTLLNAMSLRIGSGESLDPVRFSRFESIELDGLEQGLTTWEAIEAERREEAERQRRLGAPLGSLAQAVPAANLGSGAAGASVATAAAGPSLDSIAASTHANGPIRTLAERRTVRIGETLNRDVVWTDLPAYIGEPLRVSTRQGGTRVVELLKVEGDRLRVRARISGGTADFSIQRSALRWVQTTPQTRSPSASG